MDDNVPEHIDPSFNIPQERIDQIIMTVNTTESYFNTFQEFAAWSTANIHNLYVEQVYSIL